MQILHVGAYGVLVHAGRILLLHKQHGPHAGKWDLPGGRLEHGEAPEACLIREIREKTNIVTKAVTFKNIHNELVDFTGHEGPISLHHLSLLYLVPDFETKTRLKDSLDDINHESDDGVRWLKISDLHEADLSPVAWHSLKLVE